MYGVTEFNPEEALARFKAGFKMASPSNYSEPPKLTFTGNWLPLAEKITGGLISNGPETAPFMVRTKK